MYYLLRLPLSKINISKIIPSNTGAFNSTVVCPSCRKLQTAVTFNQKFRLQPTNTKSALLSQLMKKKRKKVKKGEYSELIQVAEFLGSKVRESRAFIKKSSSKDVLQSLGVNINGSKMSSSEITELNKASNNMADSVNNVPETSLSIPQSVSNLSTSLPLNAEPGIIERSMQIQTPKENIINTSKNLSKNRMSSKKKRVPENQNLELKNVPATNIEPLNSNANGMPCIENKKVVNSTTQKTTKIGKTKRQTVVNVPSQDQEEVYKVKKMELEKTGKDLHFNLSLRAFLDVCVNSDMVNLAHSTLMWHLAKGKTCKNASTITDVRLCNAVLNAHAQKGNWTRVNEVLSVMREAGIALNLQTYVACFECLSHLVRKDNVICNLIQDTLHDIEKNGLDIARLDHECIFVNDQRENVIKVIQKVIPDFRPLPLDIPRHYECNLLSRLNEDPPEDRVYNPSGGAVTYEQLSEGLGEQMQIEISNEVKVKSIERLEMQLDEKTKKMRSVLKECQENWRDLLLRTFEVSIKELSNRKGMKYEKSVTLYPFLVALNPDAYVDVMLQEVRLLAESSETFSPSLTTLHCAIGTKVMNRYLIQVKQKEGIVSKIEAVYRKYCEYYVNAHLTSRYTPREYWQKLMTENMEGPSTDVEDRTWPGHILIGLGKFMYDMIIQEVKINTNLLKFAAKSGYQIPALYSVFRSSGFVVHEEIKPHPVLVQLYKLEMNDTLTFEGTAVPTLVPPLPWTSISSGGYLLSSTKLVRMPDVAMHQKLLLEKTPNQQLFPVYDALNQLSECPWKINKPVLDIIIKVFNNKGDESLDIPPPSTECGPLPSILPDMTKEERAKTFRERALLKRRRAEMHSLRCDGLYKLSIANHVHKPLTDFYTFCNFRDKIFWFPHNLDFRGRVYPCPPHFNHLGCDMSRSILLFAKGEPLGEKGLDWLKIHLINLTGLKKQEPIHKRLSFANEMMSEIKDSADNPFNGRMWWAKSDEPWQTLACCMEIVNAERSPDPTKYICYFPVHQDGSCNGLQHYAALGRDEQGAREVNLHPMATPQDVYTGVAKLIEEARAKDAANGNKLAQILEGQVKRKVIKQTVMTTVYGVTRYGARLQILKQLKDLSDIPEDKIWAASGYLVQKTFESIQTMFTSTKEIQDWFTEMARLISHVCGQPVGWVTPLGLPIIQPYHRPNKGLQTLETGGKSRIRLLSKMDISLRPNVMKQKNAFPPNFIHSLDSCHMMLTSLFCQREGITFVSVHDCYWTHPSENVARMNTICREQFVALHNEPILENLSKFLTQKYSYTDDELQNDGSVIDMAKKRLNKLIICVPATGKFDLKNVLNSTYFFS